VPGFSGVDSEVGRLRAVIVHRPGAELKRVLPRQAGQLLFAGLPWAARAQQEHDIFTQVLRDHGVQVLYLTELLQDVLEYAPAWQQAITAALGSVLVGDELAGQLRRHLDGLAPEDLAETLITGLTAGEFRSGRGGGRPGPAAGRRDRVRPRGPRAVGRRGQPPGAGARPGGDARTERGHPGQAGTIRNREHHRAGQ